MIAEDVVASPSIPAMGVVAPSPCTNNYSSTLELKNRQCGYVKSNKETGLMPKKTLLATSWFLF